MRQLILTSALCITLAGCHPPTPPAPIPLSPEQKSCLARCDTQTRHCQHQYRKIYNACVVQAHQQATLNYQAYVKDQLAHRKKPKNLKPYAAFFDTRPCEQQLHCTMDQKACYHDCGLNGQI